MKASEAQNVSVQIISVVWMSLEDNRSILPASASVKGIFPLVAFNLFPLDLSEIGVQLLAWGTRQGVAGLCQFKALSRGKRTLEPVLILLYSSSLSRLQECSWPPSLTPDRRKKKYRDSRAAAGTLGNSVFHGKHDKH